MSRFTAPRIPLCLLAIAFTAAASAQAPVCSFEVVPSATTASDTGLGALAVVSANDVWAVGSAARTGGRRSYTMHWNGVRWTEVPAPNGTLAINYLTGAAAVASNDVWAVGYSMNQNQSQATTLTLHWNGTAWSVVPSPNPTLPGSPFGPSDKLFGVAAASANDVWAVGQTFDFTDSAPLAMHWNGSSWSVATIASPGNQAVLNGVSALGTGDVWAVGDQSIVGSQTSLIEHWNGAAWSVVPSPNVGPFLNSFLDVAALAANDVWAVGYQLTLFGINQVFQTAVLHWNGTAWSAVPSPNVNQRNQYLFGVAGVAANDVWAVGLYDTGLALRTLVEHWDGQQWTIVPSPNAGTVTDELFGIAAVNAHDLFAVGDTFDGIQYETLVERLGGEGQANSATATLTVNGSGGGSCPGPRHVDVMAASTVQLGFSGPPNMPLLLGIGSANAGVPLGCPGILGIGTPPLFTDLVTISGFAPGSPLHLDAAGSFTLPAPLGAIPPGTVIDIQAAIAQPSGCGVVLTAAFQATVR
jgi:hypothetical protein